MGISKEELERLDDQGMVAWDTHDADAFVALLADDFVWSDWTLPEPIRDKEAARTVKSAAEKQLRVQHPAFACGSSHHLQIEPVELLPHF